MKMFRNISGVAAVVLVASVMVSCGGGETVENSATAKSEAEVQIRGAGATFPEPLYQAWIKRFAEVQPDVAFSYEGVGSGEGIKRFVAESVDFGASDAAMNDEEIAKVGRGVKMIPTTAGMVVLAYNLPGFDGELKLPRDVYVDIFLGKIWRWDDPRILEANPGINLPPKLIQPVVRRDGSGTTFAFTNHLSTISEDWRDNGPGYGKQIDWPGGAMTGKGNEGVAQKVKLSQGAIGYMEYGFAKRLGLPMATLQNQAGAFARPAAETGSAALAAAELPDNLRLFIPDPVGDASYPIVSLTWVLLYGTYNNAGKKAGLSMALDWALSEGQEMAVDMGYIPLPEVMVAKASQAVAEIH